MTATSLPILSDDGLSRYMAQVQAFPILDKEEEYMLAYAWNERQDVDAAHKLVTSHLRLVVKMAHGFRGYGLPLVDLISEGNIGLMQAVKRFDYKRGFRLSTYAMWWINASINEYILRSWSLVKMGTTAAQKKLFFNLKRLKRKIFSKNTDDLLSSDSRNLIPDEISIIASELGVSERDVLEMDQRMCGSDTSLNRSIGDDDGSEFIDHLEDASMNQEELVSESHELSRRRILLEDAMKSLNEREVHILRERRLKEKPSTLEDLSQLYSISRERVRQIEARAVEKLQKNICNAEFS